MTPTQLTLLMIAAFVVLMVGSFVWFVATWDASKEQPVVDLGTLSTAPILLAENIPGEMLKTGRFSTSGAAPPSKVQARTKPAAPRQIFLKENYQDFLKNLGRSAPQMGVST